MVCSTDRSKAVVPVLVLLLVALWFILRGDLLYVFPCVIFVLVFFSPSIAITSLGEERGLIRRGAGEYEARRISEAEQKRVQRRARTKASPTELSSSDLSCSICNRQFRADWSDQPS